MMIHSSPRHARRYPPRRRLRIAVASTLGPVLVLAGGLFAVGAQAATTTVPLLTAANFSVLGATTVTNTGNTNVLLDLGVSPGTAVTGFPPGIVHGTIHANDAVAIQAQTDLEAAYLNAFNRTPTATVASELGGLTLGDGVYAATAKGPLTVNGTLTLNGGGDPTSTFIFQTDSTLITGSNSHVVLINGADACRVFWQVGSSATLGTTSSFAGSILALTAISADPGVVIEGRTLARGAAVTLNNTTFLDPRCESGSTTVTAPAVTLPAVTQTVTDTVTVAAVTETVTVAAETATVTLPAVTETVTVAAETVTDTATVTETQTNSGSAAAVTVTKTVAVSGGGSGSGGAITINSGGGAEGDLNGALVAGLVGLLGLLAGLIVFLRRRQHS